MSQSSRSEGNSPEPNSQPSQYAITSDDKKLLGAITDMAAKSQSKRASECECIAGEMGVGKDPGKAHEDLRRKLLAGHTELCKTQKAMKEGKGGQKESDDNSRQKHTHGD